MADIPQQPGPPLSRELRERYLGKPARRGRLIPLAEGLFTPLTGLSFMRQKPALWTYGVAPIVLNLLITLLTLVLLIVAAWYSIDYVHASLPEGWLWLVVKIICDIALLVLAIAGAFVTWLILQAVLCAFFYERLARQVELLLGIDPTELRDVPLLDQISTVIRDVLKLVIVNVGLLALHVIPVVGSVAAVCGSFYFNCLVLGSEFFAYPQDLRGKVRVEKRRFARENRYHTLGVGAAVIVVLLIPVVGAVLLTTAVTGTVLLYRRLTLAESGVAADQSA